jgi:hypothetical protein
LSGIGEGPPTMTRKRLLIALVVAIVLSAGTYRYVEGRRDVTRMDEFVPPGEEYQIAEAVTAMLEIESHQKIEPPPYKREVHNKAHGCVRAVVDVLPGLRAALRHGVFGNPRKTRYQAWIRFSNGNLDAQNDWIPDARGFALKVMEVEGPSLFDSLPGPHTQDFTMTNTPVFFVRNVEEYVRFARFLANNRPFAFFVDGSLNPLRWQMLDLARAIRIAKLPPASLLHTEYYTGAASKLGPDLNVKTAARPCTTTAAASRHFNGNTLREALVDDLKRGDGCFDLMVQPQIAGANMPIEDATVEWSERESPYEPVARVTIEKQTFDTDAQNAFCEALSFQPWHSLVDHRPLGGLNRLRRVAYEEDTRYRLSKNTGQAGRAFVAPPEPRNWCLDSSPACDADQSAKR